MLLAENENICVAGNGGAQRAALLNSEKRNGYYGAKA